MKKLQTKQQEFFAMYQTFPCRQRDLCLLKINCTKVVVKALRQRACFRVTLKYLRK